jgi:hypothetical protein
VGQPTTETTLQVMKDPVGCTCGIMEEGKGEKNKVFFSFEDVFWKKVGFDLLMNSGSET